MIAVPIIPSTAFEIMKTKDLKSQIVGGIEICVNNGQSGNYFFIIFSHRVSRRKGIFEGE